MCSDCPGARWKLLVSILHLFLRLLETFFFSMHVPVSRMPTDWNSSRLTDAQVWGVEWWTIKTHTLCRIDRWPERMSGGMERWYWIQGWGVRNRGDAGLIPEQCRGERWRGRIFWLDSWKIWLFVMDNVFFLVTAARLVWTQCPWSGKELDRINNEESVQARAFKCRGIPSVWSTELHVKHSQ